MSRKHTFRKGEKLEALAKKYKFKKFDLIWKENKLLQKKRGKPENIAPGDVIEIPMSPEEKAEIDARRALLLSQIESERLLAATLETHAIVYEEAAAEFAGYIKESNAFYGRMTSQLDTDYKNIMKMKMGVDIAWEIASMARTMGKLGADYKGALKDSGKMSKLNEKMKNAAESIAKRPKDYLSGEASKAIKDYVIKKGPKELKTAIEVHQIMEDSVKNMQSVTFWYLAAASKLEGKSFEESMTRDLGAEKKEQSGSLKIQQRVEIAKMEATRTKCIKFGAEHRTAQKAALLRAKMVEKLLKLIPVT